MNAYALQTASALLATNTMLTKRAATEAARQSRPKETTIAQAVADILSSAEHILAQRKSRFVRRATAHGAQKIGERVAFFDHRPTGRKSVRLPTGSLPDRLSEIRVSAVLSAYRSVIRVPGSDHGDERIILTDDPTKVGVEQSQGKDWNLYKGSYKGWAATVTDTKITVPTSWRVRVEKQGLAALDGMFTLDAQPLMTNIPGVRMFAARWVSQSRGYSVQVHDGVIAIDDDNGGLSYHGASINKALTGLRRKAKLAALTPAEKDARAEKNRRTRLENLTERCGDTPMTVADARAIGACEYGIYSWCHAVGIDPEGTATLAEVVAGYWQRPQPEAYAAILHAARRC